MRRCGRGRPLISVVRRHAIGMSSAGLDLGFVIRAMSSMSAACIVSAALAQEVHASNAGELIPPYSLELEKRTQPWCPGDCALAVPFTAVYKSGDRTLVFVGVRHVFTPENTTIRAIDLGFASVRPALVIVEGFPTAMGDSPEPLVKHARKRGTPEEDQFTKSEPMYAISRAMSRGIPFIGGEPTRAEQAQALKRKGYATADIAFAFLLGGLSQSVRSGELGGTADPGIAESFARWSNAFSDQHRLQPLSLEEVEIRYRSMFGVELRRDDKFITRLEPGTASPLALLNQADMIARDEHLLAIIDKEVAARRRVLVVYGGSHWSTLSQALLGRFGEPKITPFPDTTVKK